MAAPNSSLTLASTLRLAGRDGQIPVLGFGTYESPPGDVCYHSCLAALRAGYRHIDTAQYYANEAAVGRAILDSGVPRSEVFVTSKILFPGEDLHSTYETLAQSVRKISTGRETGTEDGADNGGPTKIDADGQDRPEGYVDLFLVHSPTGGREKRELLWRALERAKEAGLAKNIGVSNYGAPQIDEMKAYAEVWPPAVNQIELHPWCQQRNCVKYCQDNDIVVEAYCPIVRNQKADDPVVRRLSGKHGKSPSQVLIRWALEKGFVPLPKSDTPSRIGENADVFGWGLDGDDVEALDGLDEGRAGSIVHAVEGD